ncbi:hypothetical protein CLU79DRAFT_731330 [Phycomyces nitens]|nr:hypothetical protein CLU79DRAFT_731330 [Phycomyces nitens]
MVQLISIILFLFFLPVLQHTMSPREISHNTHSFNIASHSQSSPGSNNPSVPPPAIQRTYRAQPTPTLPNQTLDYFEDEEAIIGTHGYYDNHDRESHHSRFSLLGRATSRPSSTHSRQSHNSMSSIFQTESRMSRPPTYQQYDNPEDADQHRNDIECLNRLEELYRTQHGSDFLGNRHSDNYTRHSEDQFTPEAHWTWKERVGRALWNQFLGLFIALWIVVFVFLGCLTVFLPLPAAAYALWTPLVLYVIGVLIINTYERRTTREMATLRQQVNDARRRRIQELIQAMNLPENHYFEIQDDPKHHGHPVMTLLPPPPGYQNKPLEMASG